MSTYVILVNPGHNRVYFEASKALSIVELEIAAHHFSTTCSEIEFTEIKGIPYLKFNTSKDLSDDDIVLLSRLSFVYAIFELIGNETGIVFKPIQKSIPYLFNDDINTILKYSGKTNELFTRLMINVGILSSDFEFNDDINLLDPVAGKGTTLFEGLTLGYNSYGIEINEKAVHEASIYFKKYLENSKYKHTMKKEKLSGANKSFKSLVYRFEFAKSKEDYKDDKLLQMCLVSGSAQNSVHYFKKNLFHIIIGDLPYGIQHGNISKQNKASFTRNPKELLDDCLPGWIQCLKVGGVIVLAWNKNVLKVNEIKEILLKYHLNVLDSDLYTGFEHRVDQSINRDIIVAKKGNNFVNAIK